MEIANSKAEILTMPQNTMILLNAKTLTMLAILEIFDLMMLLTVGTCFRISTSVECGKCKWMIALNFMSKNVLL